MKKIISIAFAAILAGFAISCQKEELVSEKTDAVQYTFNISVNDRVGFDSESSTKGGTSGPTYKTAWGNGDKIFLFFKPDGGSLLNDRYATLTYNGSSWDGTVSSGQSNLGEGGTLSAVYVYNLGSDVEPEYSDTDSKWTIATGNVFYNCQTGVSYTVSNDVISATLNLEAPTDFVWFTIYGTTGNTLTCDKVKGWKDVVIGSDMTFSNATCTGYMTGFENIGNSMYKDFYGCIVDETSFYGVDCEFSVVKNGKVYEHTAKPGIGARSFLMSTAASGDLAWTEAVGKLPGLFTVGKGADGKAGTEDDVQVRFSQGNLWYGKVGSATSATWNFETNQYDSTPASSGNWNNSHVSHFFWSKEASVACYDSYSGSGTSDSDVFFTNDPADSEKARTDFTVNGVTGKYRTLSTAEWQYLFSYDGSGSGGQNYDNDTRRGKYKYGVTVCGKTNCVVLLPDNWAWNASTVGTDWQTDYPETKTGTEVTWGVMQAAGAVCLPAAGNRNGSEVKYVGEKVHCWSSSASGEDEAYYVSFNSGNVSSDSCGRGVGFSVRLITECQ